MKKNHQKKKNNSHSPSFSELGELNNCYYFNWLINTQAAPSTLVVCQPKKNFYDKRSKV